MTKNQETEYLKCVNNPHYFMTNYWKVNEEPFTTELTEKQFNHFFKLRQWLYKPRKSNQFLIQ